MTVDKIPEANSVPSLLRPFWILPFPIHFTLPLEVHIGLLVGGGKMLPIPIPCNIHLSPAPQEAPNSQMMSLRSWLGSGIPVIFASSQSCQLCLIKLFPERQAQQPCHSSEGTKWLWRSLSCPWFLFLAKPTAGKGFPSSCCVCSPPPLAADQPCHSALVLLDPCWMQFISPAFNWVLSFKNWSCRWWVLSLLLKTSPWSFAVLLCFLHSSWSFAVWPFLKPFLKFIYCFPQWPLALPVPPLQPHPTICSPPLALESNLTTTFTSRWSPLFSFPISFLDKGWNTKRDWNTNTFSFGSNTRISG